MCNSINSFFNNLFNILLLIDKNMLISGGKDGIKFWNNYNYELITYINKLNVGIQIIL